MITDTDGKILFVNSRIEEFTQYASDELVGQLGYKTLLSTDSWNLTLNKNESTLNGVGDGYTVEIYRKDDSKFWANIKETPYKNSDGVISGKISVITDISGFKETEKALELTEAKYKLVVENVREVIFQTDREGKITFINSFWMEITGYKINDTVGKYFVDFVYSKDKTKAAKEFVALISGRKKFIHFDVRCKKKDGSIRWFNANAKIFYSRKKIMIGVSGTLTDIEEKKNTEAELIKAKEKAEESDRIKSLFLAQISHEIRTPVNNILNYNSLIKETIEAHYKGIMQDAVKSIENSGNRLVRTIDLILNMSMLQAGNYELTPKLLNLAKILVKLAASFKTAAENKNLELLFENNSKDAVLFIDEYTIINAFQSIIDNAIKYTETGKVTITIYNSSKGVAVDIKDTGIGISKEYLKQIFQPFTQEESGYSRSFDGNGLGLALSKKYFEMNNAELSVNTEKGKGTKFTVTFNQN